MSFVDSEKLTKSHTAIHQIRQIRRFRASAVLRNNTLHNIQAVIKTSIKQANFKKITMPRPAYGLVTYLLEYAFIFILCVTGIHLMCI